MHPRKVRLPGSGGVTLGTKASQFSHYNPARRNSLKPSLRDYRLGSSQSSSVLERRSSFQRHRDEHGTQSPQKSSPESPQKGEGGMQAPDPGMSVYPGETATFNPGGTRRSAMEYREQKHDKRLASSPSLIRSPTPESQYPQTVNIGEMLNSTFDKVAESEQYKWGTRSQEYLSGRRRSDHDPGYAHGERRSNVDPPYSTVQSAREEKSSLRTEAKRWAPTQRTLTSSLSATRKGRLSRLQHSRTTTSLPRHKGKQQDSTHKQPSHILESTVRQTGDLENTLNTADTELWQDGVAKGAAGRQSLQFLAQGLVTRTHERGSRLEDSGRESRSFESTIMPEADEQERKQERPSMDSYVLPEAISAPTEHKDDTGSYLEKVCKSEIQKAERKFSDLSAANNISAGALIKKLQHEGVVEKGTATRKDNTGKHMTVVDKSTWYRALRNSGITLNRNESELLFLKLNPRADSHMDVRQVSSLFRPKEISKIDPAHASSPSKKSETALTTAQLEEFKRQYPKFFDTRGRIKGYGRWDPETLNRLGKAPVEHPEYIAAVTRTGKVIFDDRAIQKGKEYSKKFERSTHMGDLELAQEKLKQKMEDQESKCIKLFRHFDSENRGYLTQDQFVAFCGENGLCLPLPANQMKALLDEICDKDGVVSPANLLKQTLPGVSLNPGDKIDEYYQSTLEFLEKEAESECKFRGSLKKTKELRGEESKLSDTTRDEQDHNLSQSIDFKSFLREPRREEEHPSIQYCLHPEMVDKEARIGKPTWSEEEIHQRSRNANLRSGSESFMSGSQSESALTGVLGQKAEATGVDCATTRRNNQNHTIHRSPGLTNQAKHELRKKELYTPGLTGAYKQLPDPTSSLSKRTRRNLRSSGVDSVTSLVSQNNLDSSVQKLFQEASHKRVMNTAGSLKPPDLATELHVTGCTGTSYYCPDSERWYNKRTERAPDERQLVASGGSWKKEVFDVNRSYLWDQPGNPQIGGGDGEPPIDKFTEDQRKDRAFDMDRRMNRQRRKERNFNRTMETYAKEEEEKSIRDRSNIWSKQYQTMNYMKSILARKD